MLKFVAVQIFAANSHGKMIQNNRKASAYKIYICW